MKEGIMFCMLVFFASKLLAQVDLRPLVESALARGEKNISIPKGTYSLMADDHESITLKNIKDVRINGNGSVIICKKPSRAFDIVNCENLQLANFSLDYDPLPFTEGKIVEMDEKNKSWWIVEIFDGYPFRGIDLTKNRINIYNPKTNLFKENMKTYGIGDFNPNIEYLGEKRIKISKKTSNQPFDNKVVSESMAINTGQNEQTGDLLVMLLDNKGCRANAIVLNKTIKCKLENIIIYTANMFGIVEDECDANYYHRCIITKNLEDKKVSYPRLRSVGGDAFHSTSAYKGPTIEECRFEYQGDDCINIGTRYHIVFSSENKLVYILSAGSKTNIEPGNRLQVVGSDGRLRGTTHVVSVKDANNKFTSEEIKKVTDLYTLRNPQSLRSVICLELTDNFSFIPGDLICSLDKAGDGFILKNNKFGYTRARGALLKGTGGQVIGNTFEGNMLSAISVAPEFYWLEGTYASDLLISGNTFIHCQYGISNPGLSQCGTITVVCINSKNQVADSEGFRNIRIINNKIVDCPYPSIVLTSITGGELSGNIIEKSKNTIRSNGSKFGFSNSNAICSMYLKDFIEKENTIK